MPGLIVCGDNHFVVRGPRPNSATVRALVRNWSLISIGGATPPELQAWTISTREFREELEWAFVVPSEIDHTVAVTELLHELAARGVPAEIA